VHYMMSCYGKWFAEANDLPGDQGVAGLPPIGKLRDSDGIQPGSDRHGLLPMREPPSVAQIGFLHQQTVRDYLIFDWGDNEELAGGFVIGVVDHGKPLARQIRPVLAEECSFVIFVFADAQPAGGDAVVANGECTEISGTGCAGHMDGQAVGLVLELDSCCRRRDFGHRHALAAGG
jgi:hypothetical protein